MAEFDDIYRQTENVLSTEPTKILEKFFHLIDKNKPVLDIGAGQGRNSIFLARNGFRVDAVEPSVIGINSLLEIIKNENLSINTYMEDFITFTPEIAQYSAILLFGLVQVISREELNLLLKKIDEWTSEGSLIYVTAHSVKDQRYFKHSSEMKKIGKNSFSDGSKIRTYLEENEILDLFCEWDRVYHLEGYGPEHRHGDGSLERHFVIDGIFRKN
jgi:cyclopropane fatty-acyl-phospholipid synthase-like methyltransferase